MNDKNESLKISKPYSAPYFGHIHVCHTLVWKVYINCPYKSMAYMIWPKYGPEYGLHVSKD